MQPSKTIKLSLVTLAALAAGLPAEALAANFYLGAGGLGSELEPRVNTTTFTVTETNSSGARVFAGFDFTRRFSMEGYYSELGAATLSSSDLSGDIDYTASGISALYYLYSSRGSDGLLNRDGLMVYGKAGLGVLSNDSTNNIVFDRLNDEHLAAGLGMEYNFSNGFGVRAEFLNHDSDARDISFNLIKRFGSHSEVLPDAPNEIQSVETDVPAVIETMPVAPVAVVETPAPVVPVDSDADGVSDDADLCIDSPPGAIVDENGCAFSGVLDGVNFNSGSAELTPEASTALDNVIVELSNNPGLQISVLAHTDNRGDAANNMALSRERAVTVVRYLSDIGGISLGRMQAVGYGESRPLESNQSPQGRAANRRVEIEIIQ